MPGVVKTKQPKGCVKPERRLNAVIARKASVLKRISNRSMVGVGIIVQKAERW